MLEFTPILQHSQSQICRIAAATVAPRCTSSQYLRATRIAEDVEEIWAGQDKQARGKKPVSTLFVFLGH